MTTTADVRICANCMHFKPGYEECGATPEQLNMVNGRKQHRVAMYERTDTRNAEACGPSGRNYRAREPF